MWNMINTQRSLLFLIEDSGNDLNVSSTENQLNQLWLIYTMDFMQLLKRMNVH